MKLKKTNGLNTMQHYITLSAILLLSFFVFISFQNRNIVYSKSRIQDIEYHPIINKIKVDNKWYDCPVGSKGVVKGQVYLIQYVKCNDSNRYLIEDIKLN